MAIIHIKKQDIKNICEDTWGEEDTLEDAIVEGLNDSGMDSFGKLIDKSIDPILKKHNFSYTSDESVYNKKHKRIADEVKKMASNKLKNSEFSINDDYGHSVNVEIIIDYPDDYPTDKINIKCSISDIKETIKLLDGSGYLSRESRDKLIYYLKYIQCMDPYNINIISYINLLERPVSNSPVNISQRKEIKTIIESKLIKPFDMGAFGEPAINKSANDKKISKKKHLFALLKINQLFQNLWRYLKNLILIVGLSEILNR